MLDYMCILSYCLVCLLVFSSSKTFTNYEFDYLPAISWPLSKDLGTTHHSLCN
jgi:hypothetical protein